MPVRAVVRSGMRSGSGFPVPTSRSTLPGANPSWATGEGSATWVPPRPRVTTAPRREAEPRREPTPRRTSRPEPRQAQERSGGSRIGSDFLGGAGSSTTTEETRIPASQIGASAKASIIQAIIRQIKPHWSAPQGVDADQLVSILSFRLNEDGSLAGTPRVVSQSGETAANRPQKALHAERAVRAVQLAAPFDLPPEYYNAWRSIDGARFDRNLSR